MELKLRQETSQALDLRPSLPLNDNGVRVVVVSAVFIALATVAVALRFYARYLKKVSYGLEDWFLLASTVRLLSSAQHRAGPNTFQDSLLCLCIHGYTGSLRRRHRLSRQRLELCATSEGPQGTLTNQDNGMTAKLQLILALDITCSSNIVCDWAWTHQMQHLLDAHSNILRQTLPTRGILSNGVLYGMGAHDNLTCILALPSVELQLEFIAHCWTLWRSALRLCSRGYYRHSLRRRDSHLTPIHDLEPAITYSHQDSFDSHSVFGHFVSQVCEVLKPKSKFEY